jgi:hypothetical protein
MMPTFKLLDFRPRVRNTLRGFVSGRLDFGEGIALDLADLTLHRRGGKEWIGWPAKPLIDRDGQVLRDEAGKARYSGALVRPANRGAAARIEAAILAAVRRAHPDAIGNSEAA